MNIFGLGAPELALILFVLLLFFGKDKLPGPARSIGQSFKELKDGFVGGTTAEKEKGVGAAKNS
jgi:TatA/E family protein of Tat protein translocase